MALSIVTIPGDGVTDTFTVSFALGVLDQSQVTAWVTGEYDGLGDKVYRTITFLTDTLLKISGAKAGSGVNVVFTRTVPNNSLIVNYEDGDIMNEVNLNTAQKQALMLVHQVLDGRFTAFIQNVSAGGFKITNLGTPTDPNDAVNKAYADGLILTGQANVIAAAASAAAALVSQTAAAGSANSAATSAGNSLTYSNNSSTYANNSSNSAIAAAASASSALTYSNNSASYAALAQQWANELEDVPVLPGLYSAFHWAQKAMGFVSNSIATTIHAATAKTTLADADELGIIDSAASFALKKSTWANIKANVLAYFNATAKATPIDADRIWVGDSTAANIPKYTTFTQIKAFLKTYFDTVYATIAHTHAFSSLTGIPTTVAGYGILDVIFTKKFVSTQQTITQAGALTIAHGLGIKPDLVVPVIQCVTAELGYSVGDEVMINPHVFEPGSTRGIMLVSDTTNINVKFSNNAGMISAVNKTTGALAVFAIANWRFVVKAWA